MPARYATTMDPRKTKRLRPAIVYGLGIAIAYLLGVGSSGYWQPLLPAMLKLDGSAQVKSRDLRDSSTSATEDSRSTGRKLNDRTRNNANRPVTTERIRAAFLVGDPIRRQIEFARLIADADASNIDEIRAMFFEFDRSGLTYDSQWRMLWHQWGALDPQTALAQINKEVADGAAGYDDECHQWIFSAWAANDPAGAIAALKSITKEGSFEAAYYGVISGMPIAEATRFAENSEFDGVKFASQIAESLADRKLRETSSITDLKGWYGNLKPSFQEAALDHVYWRIRTADFNDAADWIQTQAEAGAPTKRIAAEMTNEYLRRNDLTGVSWYLSLPATSQDPERIQEWANRIDPNSSEYRSWAVKNEQASRLLESNRTVPSEASH